MRRTPHAAAALAVLALSLAAAPAARAGGKAAVGQRNGLVGRAQAGVHAVGGKLSAGANALLRRKPGAKAAADPAETRAKDAARVVPDRGKPKIEQYDDPSFFGEKDEHPSRLPAAAWRARGFLVDRLETANGDFLSGKAGRLKAARFVNRGSRTDGDFRYAYGKAAFEAFVQADDYLAAIPRGQLADRLSVELLAELSRISLVPGDAPLKDRLLFLAHRLEPGPGSAGNLRQANRRMQLTDPTDEELAVLKQRGLTYVLGRTLRGKRTGYVKLVAKDEVAPRLQRLLDDTRAALRDPSADPIRVAARFVQEFIAIHPFLDGNGRLSRLVMDAILRDQGLLPPILTDSGRDLTLTEDQMVAELEVGITRMAAQLGSTPQKTINADGSETWSQPDSWEASLARPADGAANFTARQFSAARVTMPDLGPASPALVRLGNHRFMVGKDGFAYDLAGRPHLVNQKGELEPLSQLAFYSLVRRIARGKDPEGALRAVTQRTREALGAVDPARVAEVTVRSDLAAIKADNHYQLTLPDLPAEDLLARYDLAELEPEALFGTVGEHPGPTYVMSRWQQHDLELWHVQGAFERRGDAAAATAILARREALFGKAKAYLGQRAAAAGTATAGNPLGLAKEFERVQFELSPLAASSLAEHIKRNGDDDMIVFRGDLPFTRYTGVHPDNVPMRGGARQAGEKLDGRRSTFGLVRDLERVEGSNVNSGYQSFTSDLSLLTRDGGFGGQIKRIDVNLTALPGLVRGLVVGRLAEGQRVGVRNLRGLLRVALGRAPPTVPGKLDVTGLDAAEAHVIVDSLGLSLATQARLHGRIDGVIGGRRAPGVADRVRQALGFGGPTLIGIEDVVDPGEVESLASAFATKVNVVQVEREGDTLHVTTSNRAHAMRIAKAVAIPGIDALGGGFDFEQEIHVIDRVLPTQVKAVWTTSKLNSALAAPTGAAAAEAPAAQPAAEAPAAQPSAAAPSTAPIKTTSAAKSPANDNAAAGLELVAGLG